mmetsp:Transcript_22601/g.38641  ORF Transcript_22601/g.38641 Transcript_22601/m.38641 type:complete len:92 (-) Transcript_22601:16-291(-)
MIYFTLLALLKCAQLSAMYFPIAISPSISDSDPEAIICSSSPISHSMFRENVLSRSFANSKTSSVTIGIISRFSDSCFGYLTVRVVMDKGV